VSIEQLDELMVGEGDGTGFFHKTRITEGMQDLISDDIARLAGVSTWAIGRPSVFLYDLILIKGPPYDSCFG
jgi:hypothetical protein